MGRKQDSGALLRRGALDGIPPRGRPTYMHSKRPVNMLVPARVNFREPVLFIKNSCAFWKAYLWTRTFLRTHVPTALRTNELSVQSGIFLSVSLSPKQFQCRH